MNIYHQIYKRPSLIKQHIAAPLFKERLEYLQYCAANHIVHTSLMRIAHFMLETVKFLHLRHARIVSIEEIESAANNWVKKRKYVRKHDSLNAKTSFICHTIYWLKSINCLDPSPEEKVELFNFLFELPHTLKRHVNAPLLKERIIFLKHMADNGSSKKYLKTIAQTLLIVMDYLGFFELRQLSVQEIKKILSDKEIPSANTKNRVMHFSIEWLKFLNCLAEIMPINKSFPFQLYLEKYICYMREEKILSEETIHGRSHVNMQFLIHAGKTKKIFSEITPLTIDEFLIKKHDVDGCSRVTIQEYASVIRSFLRYAGEQSWCHKNLANSIRSPRVYNHESLPLSPSWDDVKKILSNCKKNDSPMNIRDYAILLLLTVYGMRRGEVAHLCLDDIDWSNELLHLKRVKGSKPQIFPLIQSVGDAILDYIKNASPNACSCRELFLCMHSPYRAVTSVNVTKIVNKRLAPFNLNIKHSGPHALRHACATHLINEGVSLKEISDHLGHVNLDTTRIYAKVDLVSLRKVSNACSIKDLL